MHISFTKHVLSNGLRVIFHYTDDTPLSCVNILYDVGSKDEKPERTGFAHLFEHLMFGGSVNIPSYDVPLQKACGENNAFTTNDITNYYLILPKENIETALWLESDRMLELAFSEKSLDVQRKVVIEEFNQRYLNQPYGDMTLLLQPLCYKVHPYQWDTIGKDITHIAESKLSEVKEFYYTHYNPSNAILSVSGDFEQTYIFDLLEKWFGNINKPHSYIRNLPKEPVQTVSRRLEVERDVPQDTIVVSFPMCNRQFFDFYVWDIITGIFSQGESGRLNQSLVKKQKLFSDITAYTTGTIDEGQVIFTGYILPGVKIERAEKALWKEIELLRKEKISTFEMEKMLNNTESSMIFQNVSIFYKTMGLAYYELLGNADLINKEIEIYRSITTEDIMRVAEINLIHNKSSSLVIKSKKP